MNLLRCHIQGFGKLANLDLSFTSGLNVVYAANEGGKSTLQRFLMALLYGQLRTDVKVQRRLEAWVDPYRPWRGTDYGGVLWCRLASGRELEIQRAFGRDETRAAILTVGGEDITRQYEIQRNGEPIFAAAHIGLTKELFESAALIRESETAEIRHREPLRDRIANLAQSGDEKLSVRLSLVKLEEALESIGSDRAPTRPYRQALDQLEELQQEREELEAQRRQCQGWIHKKQELGCEIERLDQDLQAARRGVVDARWREARLRVHNLEELDREIGSFRQEISALGANPDFPTHRLDDLNRWVAERDNAAQRLQELGLQKRDAEVHHDAGETELGKLAAFAALQKTIEPEKITEWFVGYLSVSRQKDEAQRTLNRLAAEEAALQQGLDSLSPALQDARMDWERKARQAAEEERLASQQHLALADKIAQEKADCAQAAKKARSLGWLATLALLATAAAAASVFVRALPAAAGFTLAALLGAAGGILFVSSARKKQSAVQLRRSLEAMTSGLERMRAQVQSVQSEVQEAVAASGFTTVDEFLGAARQAALDRQRLEDLGEHIRQATQQRDQLQVETDAVYGHLRESLTRTGLSCAPGNLKTPVDLLRSNMRRSAEIEAAQRRLALQIESLLSDENGMAGRVREIESRIHGLLAEGNVDTPEAFRKASADCRRMLELRARETALIREFDRLRGAMTLEQWQERLDELQRLRGGPADETHVSGGIAGKPPYLPYLPSVEEAEEEEKRTAAIVAARREEHARLAERIQQAFHHYRAPAEIEEDLALTQSVVDELTLNRKSLTLALDGIRSLARLQQEVCAPQLNRMAEERFLEICPDRYAEVKIDPDFRIQVRERGGELRPADSLSRGTQDQLFFAVRFAVLELLGHEQEPCPCLLDEPFVAYDRDRMCAAFRILDQEAARRQLVLFTCREDVRDQALERGAHLVTLCINTCGSSA